MSRRRAATVAAVAMLVVATGCSGKPAPQTTPSPSRHSQVELRSQVPAGMERVELPAATPTAGMVYDVQLYRGSGCELRVVRMLLPSSDGTEDQDATYNMLGAVMKGSDIQQFTTEGSFLPGSPGPVPVLSVSGGTATAQLRALGRVSNESLQGFQLVYGCPTKSFSERTWRELVSSLRVDGFTGPLTEH